jgi:hypothetical protein
VDMPCPWASAYRQVWRYTQGHDGCHANGSAVGQRAGAISFPDSAMTVTDPLVIMSAGLCLMCIWLRRCLLCLFLDPYLPVASSLQCLYRLLQHQPRIGRASCCSRNNNTLSLTALPATSTHPERLALFSSRCAAILDHYTETENRGLGMPCSDGARFQTASDQLFTPMMIKC